jgi:hypothetical protein
MHYIIPKGKWNALSYDMQEVGKGILFIATCNSLLRFNTLNENWILFLKQKMVV